MTGREPGAPGVAPFAGRNPKTESVAPALPAVCAGFHQSTTNPPYVSSPAPSRHSSMQCFASSMPRRSFQNGTAPATSAGIPMPRTMSGSRLGSRCAFLRSRLSGFDSPHLYFNDRFRPLPTPPKALRINICSPLNESKPRPLPESFLTPCSALRAHGRTWPAAL